MSEARSETGNTNRCWYCDQPIVAPVEIVGRWLAGRNQLVHKRCLRILGELDLDLSRAEEGSAAPVSSHEETGAA